MPLPRRGDDAPPAAPGSSVRPSRRVDRLATAAVVLVATTVAGAMLARYVADPAALWRDPYHDRNSHLAFGFDLALNLRAGDLAGLLRRLELATIWPPVHGLVLSIALLLGGLDRAAAILPSLMGWVAMTTVTWLIARRLAGIAGGAVAVIFAIMSPALRLLGSDVMLEGLGAALTACALYSYQRCVATPREPRWWRILAVTLTLLFFEKYNYWLLSALPLALASGWAHRRSLRTGARSLLAAIGGGGALRRLHADPLALAAAILASLAIVIAARGPTTLHLLGHPFALHPPGNLATLAYGLILVRLALAWRRHRVALAAALGAPGRALLRLHLMPIALWFLVPQTLYGFLWFVGPTHHGATIGYQPWNAAAFQWIGFAEGFHVAPWAALLALGLAVLGLARLARGGEGEHAVAVLALLSVAVVVLHPQQQWRFQATWLFALWVCAGVGAGTIVAWLTRGGPVGRQVAVGGAIVAALLAAQLAQPVSPLADAVAIRSPDRPGDLALAAAYLPFAAGPEPLGMVASFGRTDLFDWTVREHCRCLVAIEQPDVVRVESRAAVREAMAAWLAATAARRIVFVDAKLPYEVASFGLPGDRLMGVRDALQDQDRFVRTAVVEVPAYPAEISLWQPRSEAPPPLPRLHVMEALAAALALAVAAILLI